MDTHIDAVYFEKKTMNIGAGGTSQARVEEIHYHVVEKEDGELNIEMLSATGKRSGIVVETIDKEEFLKRFSSCFEHECDFFPKVSEEEGVELAKKHAEQGDFHKENNQLKEAELAYGNALKFDEKSALANYGMAKVFLESGKEESGKNILKKLTTMDTVFKKENKHLFNEIGIDLRKQQLFGEASDYYRKAISIDSDDEILFYNFARLQKDAGQHKDSIETIKKALAIKPDFKEGKDLYAWLHRQVNPKSAKK